jgi:YVTN family beta-propeller protein|tara:strand:- start:891 stop:1940 length:1050 start_codon:yes stop_codon:yes gene_type:complete
VGRLSIIAIILSFLSCKKDKIGPQCISCQEEQIEITTTLHSDLLIINEGNFGSGSGSISRYTSQNKTVNNNLFLQANETPIGNIAQSVYQIGTKAYVVINNSNKIEVIDINNFSSLHTITGFNSPRSFLPINQNTAYVTDLYANSIQIVDLNSNSITGSISVNGWTEDLLLHNDSVYVCDMTNDNLLIINPNNNSLVDSIKVGESPNSIIIDENSMIWIMCSGGFSSTNPQLIKFNPQTRTIETTYTFPNITESPGNLKINAKGDQLYYINSNIYKMSIYSNSINTTPIITSNGNKFYEIGISPIAEEIFISDAIDYIQDGIIYRYSSSGNLIHHFNAGVIPGDFLFID